MRRTSWLRWLVGLGGTVAVVAALAAPRPVPEPEPLAWNRAALEEGDLLFRRGRDLASRVVLAADPESRFSHVGIVARLGSRLLVVHTMPREGESGGMARAVPPEEFLAPEAAADAALYRLREPRGERPRAAAAIALELARRRIPFDEAFSLATPDKLYCTELVWRAYRGAGVDLVEGRFDPLSLPLHQGPAVLPGGLTHSPHLDNVANFRLRRVAS